MSLCQLIPSSLFADDPFSLCSVKVLAETADSSFYTQVERALTTYVKCFRFGMAPRKAGWHDRRRKKGIAPFVQTKTIMSKARSSFSTS